MTKAEADTLTIRIATEMPIVQVSLIAKGHSTMGHTYALKLYQSKKKLTLTLSKVEEWPSVKTLWSMSY